MRKRGLMTGCIAALMALTAVSGAYAIAGLRCNEHDAFLQERAVQGHRYHHRQHHGCCGNRCYSDADNAAHCAYGHGATRGYYCDGRHACFNGCLIEGAALKSFTPLGGGYAKDSGSVYYGGRKIDGADAASFKYIGRGMGKDKNNVYMDGAVAQ